MLFNNTDEVLIAIGIDASTTGGSGFQLIVPL